MQIIKFPYLCSVDLLRFC